MLDELVRFEEVLLLGVKYFHDIERGSSACGDHLGEIRLRAARDILDATAERFELRRDAIVYGVLPGAAPVATVSVTPSNCSPDAVAAYVSVSAAMAPAAVCLMVFFALFIACCPPQYGIQGSAST
ncbi:MAG: hypothetical protein M5U09_30195 [Gammaproteobacteria bacterium]|nr:hypothetical protein [Gammaproteobacteria bacterium]